MTTSHSSAELLEQIEALSGQTVNDCYQCGCCTSGCPIGTTMDPPPSKAIRLLQLGHVRELLASDGIWMCASCIVCGTRCPREDGYVRIAEACRASILRSRRGMVFGRGDKMVVVSGADTISNRQIGVEADLVVLGTAMTPDGSALDVAGC